MQGCCNNIGCLSVLANRIGNDIAVVASRVGQKIVVDCSIVCSVNRSDYLYVNPTFVWLTPDVFSSAEFKITTNVSWNIN